MALPSPTPLSDCIADIVAGETPKKWARFFDALLVARLGVVVTGAPEIPGPHVAGKNEMSVCVTETPDGRVMILACADPQVYAGRYPNQGFNADMDAPSVFRTVLANPDCRGLRVNSATGEHSLVVDRAKVEELAAIDKRAKSSFARISRAIFGAK